MDMGGEVYEVVEDGLVDSSFLSDTPQYLEDKDLCHLGDPVSSRILY